MAELVSMALDETGRLVTVDQAETSRLYECLACGAAMRCRRPRFGEPGFEHVGPDCEESELHTLEQAVLRVLAARRAIRVPGVFVEFSGFDESSALHRASTWCAPRTVTSVSDIAPLVDAVSVRLATTDGDLLVLCGDLPAETIPALEDDNCAVLTLDMREFLGQMPRLSDLETWLLAQTRGKSWFRPQLPAATLDSLRLRLADTVAHHNAQLRARPKEPDAEAFRQLMAYHKMQILLACLELDRWNFPEHLNIPVSGESAFVDTPRQVWQAGVWLTFVVRRKSAFVLDEVLQWLDAHFELASIDPAEPRRAVWQFLEALVLRGLIAKVDVGYQSLDGNDETSDQPPVEAVAGPASVVEMASTLVSVDSQGAVVPPIDTLVEFPSAQVCESRLWRWTDDVPDAMQVEAARTQAHWRSSFSATLAELEEEVEARIFTEIPDTVARRIAERAHVRPGEVLQFLYSAGYIEDCGLLEPGA